ncbi:plasmid replication, integration and excision activator [Nocardioides sp.]|uniref:plasmid replication, integration and excision activator n=1 Tax=Nocardioides sp. TaxID=35761 RepID=UPI002C6F8C50|nr:plasmid replication, integration and excision activator [Nocardioides sp.]HSX69051.1 plasmid replication, integration and excision activator [Nocardioides sp.]
MAMQKRFPIPTTSAFPYGLGIKPTAEGEQAVTPVIDFDKSTKENRVQALDKDTGLPLWQVTVLDFDPEAGKKDMVVTVKFAAKVQPVPPANNSAMPFTPVEFVGLSALPYVDDSGSRPRIAWSYRADGMVEPGQAKKAA